MTRIRARNVKFRCSLGACSTKCLNHVWWHLALAPCPLVASWSLALLLSNFGLGLGRGLGHGRLGGLGGWVGLGAGRPEGGGWRPRGLELLGALVLHQVSLEESLGAGPWRHQNYQNVLDLLICEAIGAGRPGRLRAKGSGVPGGPRPTPGGPEASGRLARWRHRKYKNVLDLLIFGAFSWKFACGGGSQEMALLSKKNYKQVRKHLSPEISMTL